MTNESGSKLIYIKKLKQSEKELTATLIKLKEMGYDFVQFSGSKYDVKKIDNAIKNSGVPVVLTHVPYESIVNDPEKLTEEHLSFGCKNIGLGAMPSDYQRDENEWKKRIDEINIAAEKIERAGGKFFYHNHHFEFRKFNNGQTVFDYMIKNAPKINFTLDSYWVQYGGQHPDSFADRIQGRIECVHLKDYRLKVVDNETMETRPQFAPVGHGVLNMPAIIENWKKAGTKYFLVEQDDACEYSDPLEQVRLSIEYLKKI